MKKFLKKYDNIIGYVLFLAIVAFLAFYKLPYMVTKPGGIDDVSKQYKINGANGINGSINTAYIIEIHPNIPYFLYAKIKGYEINKIKDEVIVDLDFTRKIEKLMYSSSISNSIYVAYTKANKDIKISNLKQYIYLNDNDSSPLKTGDLLLKINDTNLDTLEKIPEIIKESSSDTVKITYERDEEVFEEEINLVEYDGEKKLGVVLITVFDYSTNPYIKYNNDKNTYGPSGGAMMALSIYCNLIDNDIVKGRKIAGTGEIYYDGLIGPVGGVEYKVRGAAKNKADIFFVPEYNYDEAIKAKEKYKLKIDIVKVKKFDDIIEYLENN